MQAQHQTHLETLLRSYGKVLRAQVDMDLSKTSDRDWRNLQTLLAERSDIGDRTISYLSNALQDAAEKRMWSSDIGEPWVETDLDETFIREHRSRRACHRRNRHPSRRRRLHRPH
jgi:hypothetical protein